MNKIRRTFPSSPCQTCAQHDDDYAVQYQPLDRYENWYPLVPDPREECGRSGGPITTHFVDGLLDIAAKAIPAIDAVEGQGQQ